MADSRHAWDLWWQSLWECERTELGINGPKSSWHSASHVTMSRGQLIFVKSWETCCGPQMAVTRLGLTTLVTWWGETGQNGSDQITRLTDGDRPSSSPVSTLLICSKLTGQRKILISNILLNNLLWWPIKEEWHGLTLDKNLWPVCGQCLFRSYDDESQSQYLLLFVAAVLGWSASLQQRVSWVIMLAPVWVFGLSPSGHCWGHLGPPASAVKW